MRVSFRISSGILFVGLTMLLAGCYQTAGSSVIPTVADLTATSAPLPVLPTVASDTPVPAANQPTATEISTTAPPATPVSDQAGASPTLIPVTLVTATPAPGQPAAQPSDTPFVTAISTQGFLTPTGGAVVITVSAGTPGSVNALTPTVLILNTPTAFPTEGACVHTVQPGEHLLSIARQYKVNLDDLLAANPFLQSNPDQLQVGQTLTIPNCGQPTVTPGAPPAAGTNAAPAGPTLYAVVKGDTLLAIAHKFNTTVAKLEQANGLNDSSILHIGQQLIIPPPG